MHDDIITTAQLYWDNGDPNECGWAYRYDGNEQGSGPVSDGRATRELMANDVLDYAVADLPDCHVKVINPDTEQVCYLAEIVDGEVINGRWV